jgi:hypothetical protein
LESATRGSTDVTPFLSQKHRLRASRRQTLRGGGAIVQMGELQLAIGIAGWKSADTAGPAAN